MRVTNSMMTSRLLLNLQRNMQYLDTLNTQLDSTKRIQVPSDDPIAAARALKFRTNVSETEQYQRNVGQGLSWMKATDSAFFNVVDIMTQIRELVNPGSTGTNVVDDRAAIAENIQQLVYQLGKEMNVTYAGRYVFSGYRTDQPPVFEADNTKAYNITQYFSGSEIESTKVVHKMTNATYGDADAALPFDVNIIKLAYTDTGMPTVTITKNGVATTQNVVTKSLSADPDAYDPAPGTINFIAETGELVLGKTVYDDMQNGTMEVSYNKDGFKEGDLNPLVYFPSMDLGAFDVAGGYKMNIVESVPLGSVNASCDPINMPILNVDSSKAITVSFGGYKYTAQNVPAASQNADGVYYDSGTGEISFGANVAAKMKTTDTVKVDYTDTASAAQSTSFPVSGLNLEKSATTTYSNFDTTGGGPTVTITNADGTRTVRTASPGGGVPAADAVTYDAATGEFYFDPALLNNAVGITVAYTNDFQAGDPNPLTNPNIAGTLVLTPAQALDFPAYSMSDQMMEYEFGVNTRIAVNTLGKNVYTDKMYADLRDFLDFVKSVRFSDEGQVLNKYMTELSNDPTYAALTADEIEAEAKKLTEEQMTNERKEAETAMRDRFNNMLGLVDKHLRNISVQETDLGSRMSRLELIQTRLAEDRTNYKELLSENEDTNMEETAIELSVAQAAYNASLMVGSKIIQMTLADYIR